MLHRLVPRLALGLLVLTEDQAVRFVRPPLVFSGCVPDRSGWVLLELVAGSAIFTT